MFEKKNYIVNCDVCDTRKITQESLSGYEQIVINADLLLVDENSRAILNRLPLICNADETLDVDVMWVPMGTARRYNISFAVNNPASGV